MVTLIHITEKQTGKILDYIPLGDFWDDNHHKSLKDTLEYFEFRTFGDKRYSQHLEKMNRIIIPDEDGTFIEFVIFHAIKYRLQNVVVVDVYAPASYLLLKKAKVIKPQRVSEYTASQHLGFALNGTEWRPGIVESDKYRSLDIENYTNPYAYIKRIANEFELEPRFRIETDGNKIIGRYVDLIERVGEWQGREVEFGRDLLGIERKVDDSNIVTALIGLGPERDDGTRLEVFVEDEEALQRWGTPNPQTGELMHLIETYEPESTDQDMTIERLTELTRNELEKRINSVVEYTADVADLEKVPGMENKVIRFGDTIKIKDTGFNPPLYLEARVHTQDRSLSQPEKKKVTLGDFIEYTEEEVHAIWKQLQAEIAKKVSMAEVTEVVYTKPEVDERDDAVREHADTVAENAKLEAIQIAAEDASQKAQQAEDNAKEYTDGRLENTVAKDIFENTVTDLLNNIAQKVDNTRFEQTESELREIAEGLQREIEEHADTLEAHGGKITKLETDVDEVEGKINATISELEVLGNTVSRHETQIDANAQAIALKADKQELDLLSGTVSDISSQLTVMAGQIEAKAERSEVEKLENDVSKVSQDVSKLTIDVDGIKTNVSSISQTVSNHGTQISNINSTLTQHADMIATKVEKSEFDSVTNSLGNRISTIEQTADSISLEVSDIKANVYTKSEVDSAIDGIQVGGRNLIRNSDFGSDGVLDYWDYWGNSISMSVENHYGYNFLKVTSRSNMRGEYYWFRRVPQEFKLVKGVKYTLSWIQVMSEGTEDPRVVIREVGDRGFGFQQMLSNFQTETILRAEVYGLTRNFVKYSTTFEISDAFNEPIADIAWRFTNTRDGQEWVMISEPKLEKGNRATDWTPAPEDIDAQIDDIEGTLESHSTKIEQNAQQIQLRATKAEVDTLTGRISNVESELNLMPDKISSRIAETAIGLVGPNLIPNGSFELDHFGWESGGTIVNEGHAGSKSLRVNAISSGFQRKYLSKLIPVIPGRTYEISFWVKTSSDSNGTVDNQKLRIGKKDGSLINQATIGWDGARTNWTKFSRLWTVPPGITEIQVSIVNNHTKGWVQWDDISIVDVTNENEVRQYAESQITQLAGQIELRATKTEVDALTGQVSSIQSQLTVMAGEIATKVEKDGVISAINQTAESIKIQASKVDLSGYVTFTNLSTPGQTTIDGGNIKTNSIRADKLNVTSLSAISANLGTVTAGTIKGVNIEGAQITQTGNTGSILLTNEGLIVRDASAKRRIGIFTSNKNFQGFSASAITFEPNTNEQFYVGTGLHGLGDGFIGFSKDVNYARSLIIRNNAYTSNPTDSKIGLWSPKVEVFGLLNVINNSRHLVLEEYDNNGKQWHIEVQNGDLRFVETNIATRLTLYPGGGLETRNDIIFSAGRGRVVAESSATYIQNNTEIRATKYKSTTYVPVRAASFPTGSLAEYKEDIHPWQESALEKIRQATIYEYYLKSELEQGIYRKRQGLVIGEGYNTPDGVIDGDGVEQYLMNAWSWKAIQELDTEQQELKGRIAWLEAENKLLREKIKKLEGMVS